MSQTARVIDLGAKRLESLADSVNAAHAKVISSTASAAWHGVLAGQALLKARALVPHGQWTKWRKKHCSKINERTCQYYQTLAKGWEKLPPKAQRVADLTSLRALMRKITAMNARKAFGGSSNPEFYSPADIVDRASAMLGGFDIDPAWHPKSPVRARRTFTKRQNGLTKRWIGRCWINPPHQGAGAFIAKLVDEYEAGNVTEAVCLLPARVGSSWFRRLDAFPWLILHGRVTYHNCKQGAPFDSAIVYLGPRVARFAQMFGELGSIRVAY